MEAGREPPRTGAANIASHRRRGRTTEEAKVDDMVIGVDGLCPTDVARVMRDLQYRDVVRIEGESVTVQRADAQ